MTQPTKVTDIVEMYGKNNVIFTLPMRKDDNCMGLTPNGEDPYSRQDAIIVEERYKIADGKKMTLRALNNEYGEIHITQREVQENIRLGHYSYRVKE